MKKTLSIVTIKSKPRNLYLKRQRSKSYSSRVSLRIKAGANNCSKQNETVKRNINRSSMLTWWANRTTHSLFQALSVSGDDAKKRAGERKKRGVWERKGRPCSFTLRPPAFSRRLHWPKNNNILFITLYNIDRTLRALWLVKNLCFIIQMVNAIAYTIELWMHAGGC